MSRTSAGLLIWRLRDGAAQVLLVHPGGPFWARRDEHAWSIPKGEPEPGEALLAAARREVAEETGLAVDGDFEPLEPVRQAGAKTVHAFAVRGAWDPAALVSGSFEMEWPPRSGERRSFPEVDRAAWFPLDEARRKLVRGQVPLLDQLAARLEQGRP